MSGPFTSQYPELVELSAANADDAARVFVQISPDYFLSRLGPRFLARVFWKPFYSGAVDFGYAWIVGGRVVGLAAGTTARHGLLGRMLRSAPIEFVRAAIGGAVRSPRVIAEAFDMVRRLARERATAGPDAELTTLGLLPREIRPVVSPETGKQVSPAVILLRACAARMQQQGAREFRLYTAARNQLACRLYRTLGFTEAHRFTLFGEERICFVRSTAFTDPL